MEDLHFQIVMLPSEGVFSRIMEPDMVNFPPDLSIISWVEWLCPPEPIWQGIFRWILEIYLMNIVFWPWFFFIYFSRVKIGNKTKLVSVPIIITRHFWTRTLCTIGKKHININRWLCRPLSIAAFTHIPVRWFSLMLVIPLRVWLYNWMCGLSKMLWVCIIKI